jgi:hypothetical protein
LRRINHVQKSTLSPWPIVSLGATPYGLYKLAGYLMKRRPVSSLMHQRKPVTDHVRHRFTGHFVRSNASLAKLVTHPIDLSAYEGAMAPN